MRKALYWLLSVALVGIILNLVASTLFEWRFPAFWGKIQDGILAAWLWLWTPTAVWRWAFGLLLILAIWFAGSWLYQRFMRGPLHTDPEDINGLLLGWIGQRSGIAGIPISFTKLDKELRLVPGSTERYIEKAAAHYRYSRHTRGKDIITFIGGY